MYKVVKLTCEGVWQYKPAENINLKSQNMVNYYKIWII